MSTLVIHVSGGFRLFDDALHDLRFRTLNIPASGELVLVEIDSDSLYRLGSWPWPRMHHALVLERLLAAGALRVGFDVSFGSPSSPDQDGLLAEAAATAGERLILPIFRQLHISDDGEPVLIVDRPIPALADVTALASVNVVPGPDGIVRRLRPIDQIGDRVVPSMSLALLGPEALAARTVAEPGLYLDFGIDVRSIPRLSFVDVVTGTFDPEEVAGKAVLVGATALELGDVLAVPRWGNLPGPLVVATGFESFRLDRAISRLDGTWFVFALCLAAALAPVLGRPERPRSVVAPALLQLVGLFALSEATYVFWALRWDIAAVAAALLASYGLEMGRVLRSQAERIDAQQQAARQRDALLRSVVDTSIDAVVIAGRDGRIQIANPACLPVFGYRHEALIGRPVAALIRADDPLAAPLLATMARGTDAPDLRYPVDVAGLHRDGHDLHLDLSIAAVSAAAAAPAGTLDRHYIFVFRDVSEQRRLEALRRKALSAQLESERSKAEFLATASHELRTPLNHIKGFASLMASGVGGAPSARHGEYLEDITGAADHLIGMVTDMLSHAQHEPADSTAARESVGVVALVEAAHHQVRALADQRGVHIAIEASTGALHLLVHRDAMERALMHVLRNAVQFSPQHGIVAVRCERTPTEEAVAITISDRGPGMSEAEVARVLQPFGQLEGTLTRIHSGLGVGLSMARASVDGHDGRLTIDSRKGEGTTVRIVLPVHRAHSHHAKA